MSKFGLEAVREAISDNESIAEQIKQRENFEAEVKRKSALGNFILACTFEDIPPEFENYRVFNPVKAPIGFMGRRNTNINKGYLTNLGFDEDFEPSKLALHASGDSISGWMSYSLKMLMENGDIEEVCSFTASKYNNLDTSEKSETHLWKFEDEVNTPIEYQSEDYDFVKNIAGLFLPGALVDLKLENAR
jgi:hypothetical protein